MQIYWNKRKRLHKKRVQLPEDWFGTPTWPPFHCFGTPIWPPVVPKSYRPKGQPRSTRNEFPIQADFGNSRKHPIWRLKRGGKLTAKGAVLSPEKRDFTVLLKKFAFIVTFEEFLVLYCKQSFYKCLINLSCPAGRHYRRK